MACWQNSVSDCLQEAGPNHYWISGTVVPYKFELGGPAHEGCAGIVALTQYLNHMAAPSSSSSGEIQQLQVSSCCAYNLDVDAGSLKEYGDMIKRTCGCVGVRIDGIAMLQSRQRCALHMNHRQPYSLTILAAGSTVQCVTALQLCIQTQVAKLPL